MFAQITKTPAGQALARRLEAGGLCPLPDVPAAAQPFFAALLQHLFPTRPIVVVTDTLKTQESFQQDLETWLALGRENPTVARTNFYPAWDVLPHENKLPHADTISDRLETLVRLSANSAFPKPQTPSARPLLLVSSVAALLQKTFAPGALQKLMRHLTKGDRVDPLELIEWLEACGYEPEAQVTQKGEIALRGGILDVFPPTSPWPVRLEFFGDELESLRHFDPLTQISREAITHLTLPPAGEIGILKKTTSVSTHTGEPTTPHLTPAPSHSASLPAPASLLDYLPKETLFILCDPDQLALRAEEYAQQIPANDPFFLSWEDFRSELARRSLTTLELTETIFDGAPVSDPARIEFAEEASPAPVAPDTAPLFTSLDTFRPLSERPPEPQIAEAQRREFFAQLHRWLRQGYAVHVFCNNAGERQRFEEIWTELGLGSGVSGLGGNSANSPAASVPKPQTLDPRPLVELGALARGFLCDDAKLVVVTDAEIFGRYKVQRPRRMKSPHAAAMRSAMEIDFADLEEGDLVVHLQHGIGRFLGLKTLPANRRDERSTTPQAGTECLVIQYAGEPGNEPPKLYVPVTEAHLISKYVGAGKLRPPLNALGGSRWRKAVEQTEKAVRDVAAELLQIQAVRESQPGHPFPPDVTWQREFESSFVYEETVDQVKAIAETKGDMERAKPMDRLICGDVGFGKTEVAIRAAFKAVMGGKQVAILVPTTVLAQQHFNNFRERMADYPVRVELLSRFRTRREQQQVVHDLAAGAVDIVVGTHRLVQDDIVFKDLGLVVIDEEQRFGVLHKEKFKRLRTLVDVLTLSATPIPRTLYLALTGARDMSTIQTPPHDRLPVETIVAEYDERTIRDAIQRELNRGGQVFFLHNRVTTIEVMAQKVKQLVPNARLVVGHGQMDADDLEEVMTQFINGEADVLISTTIIESGLDIPNANTIIIDRADRFGLSELYQLRGRVGRYKHQAFAYLLLPRHARLLTDVRKRINAMKQYSTLGSGFKIAMRDLEIRGAGNLLGSEQSGHITAVGFDLYCQLLKQSVGAMKGEKVKPRVEVSVRLDFLSLNAEQEVSSPSSVVSSRENAEAVRKPKTTDHGPRTTDSALAALPHSYVPEPQHRIEFYRKLAQATDKNALEALQKELRDRFGPLAPPVELLLAVTEIKILASEKMVTVIEVSDDKLKLTRRGDLLQLGGKFPRLTKKEPKARLKEIKKLLLALS